MRALTGMDNIANEEVSKLDDLLYKYLDDKGESNRKKKGNLSSIKEEDDMPKWKPRENSFY